VIDNIDVCVPSQQPQPNGSSTANGHTDLSESQDSDSLTKVSAHPPLVKDLSFVLKEGEHLMITGSNGVGKSSVARVLAGLWAPSAPSRPIPFYTPGEPSTAPVPVIKRPPPRLEDGRRSVFVVPQRSYMVSGSLLDQVIYPDSYADFVGRWETPKTDGGRGVGGGVEEGLKKIREILKLVHLEYLPEREGGWFTRKEWRDVLSGGEKQRVHAFFFFLGSVLSSYFYNCRWQWRGCFTNDRSLQFLMVRARLVAFARSCSILTCLFLSLLNRMYVGCIK
jgi:ATP-binding cassette, subfamily D (ALD), peroxisomal long-chain fatty acid import protein